MQQLVRAALLVAIILPSALMAQTDSIRISCPLNEAVVVPPPKNVIRYDIEGFGGKIMCQCKGNKCGAKSRRQ